MVDDDGADDKCVDDERFNDCFVDFGDACNTIILLDAHVDDGGGDVEDVGDVDEGFRIIFCNGGVEPLEIPIVDDG